MIHKILDEVLQTFFTFLQKMLGEKQNFLADFDLRWRSLFVFLCRNTHAAFFPCFLSQVLRIFSCD